MIAPQLHHFDKAFFMQKKWKHNKKYGSRLLIAMASTTSPVTGESRATSMAKNEF
jgi:hypothetical protein